MRDGDGSPGRPLDPPKREIDILRLALKKLEDLLPSGWTLDDKPESRPGGRVADALTTLTDAGGTQAVLIAEVKRSFVTRDLPQVLERLRSLAGQADPGAVPLVIAKYLSPTNRAWLDERQVPYVDATGNIRIALSRPSIFLADRGADKDPWRGPGRPRGTLKGFAAARAVRALVDYAPPVKIGDLVTRSGGSTGATYRVVEFLEEEGLVEREPRGPIRTVQWRRILERWSQDYGFQRNNEVGGYLEPRGVSAATDKLRGLGREDYAVTGSIAAQNWAPCAPPRLAMIYVTGIDTFAESLGLRPVESGANVLLAESEDEVLLDRSVIADGIVLAAPSQVAVDLLTGPGRSPSEAVALLDWMEGNERAWRR